MKYDNNERTYSEEDFQVFGDLRTDLQDLQGNFSEEYQRVASDLEFESGDMWNEGEKQKRLKKKRPCNVNNFVKPYVDRIVNPFILNPISVNIEDSTDTGSIVKEFITGVESESNAHEAYQTAFRTAVTSGRGYIHIGTAYGSATSMNQNISIDTVIDPTSTYLDSASTNIDGSDANFGVWVKYINENYAKSRHGEDVIGGSAFNVYQYWDVPDKTVPSLTYYKKRITSVKRNFKEDGTFVDGEEEVEGAVRSRYIDEVVIDCYQIIGHKIVSRSVIDMPFIPIIPVYGNRMYTKRGIQWSGIVNQVRDTQTAINYNSSNEQELIGLAPKSPWIAALGQTSQNPEVWATANTESWDVLTYDPQEVAGLQVPPPVRVDNTAQTQGLIQSKEVAKQDLARETGIYDSQFGQVEGGNQSGKALQTRNVQGELSTAHYIDNLHKSIKQVGRVLLYMMNSIYDTARTITIDDQKISVVFTDLDLNIDDYKFEILAGPSIESRKERSTDILMEVMRMHPQSVPLLAVRVAENQNVANRSSIVEDLKKLIPPEFKDEENTEQTPDPMAIQALQTAEQTITEQEQQIQYLTDYLKQAQDIIMAGDKDREAKLAEAQLKSNTELAKAEINSSTTLQKAEIDAKSKLIQEDMKQEGSNIRTAAEISSEAEKDNKKLISDITGNIGDLANSNVVESAEVNISKLNPRVIGPISVEEIETEGVLENIDSLIEGDE